MKQLVQQAVDAHNEVLRALQTLVDGIDDEMAMEDWTADIHYKVWDTPTRSVDEYDVTYVINKDSITFSLNAGEDTYSDYSEQCELVVKDEWWSREYSYADIYEDIKKDSLEQQELERSYEVARIATAARMYGLELKEVVEVDVIAAPPPPSMPSYVVCKETHKLEHIDKHY